MTKTQISTFSPKSNIFNAAVITLSLLVSACGFNPKQIDVKPKDEPVYNFTQSSTLLQCVGAHINYRNVSAVDVYVSNIPDHTVPTIETGFLTKNAVMMVTTAVDRLHTDKVAVVGQNGGLEDRRQIQIIGSFTELNRTTKSNAISGQAVFPGGVELELGGDQNFNHIALDLSMSENNRIVPGTSTSVAIQIHGNSGDVTLTYDEGRDFAAIGALGFTAQEGFHAAQRLLIETSVALMMSKYFDIDVRNCLNETKKPDISAPVNSYDRAVFGNYEDNVYVPFAPMSAVPMVHAPVMPLAAPQPMIIDRNVYHHGAAPMAPSYPPQDPNGPVLLIDEAPFYGGTGMDSSFNAQDAVDFNSFAVPRRELPQTNGYVYIPRNGKKQYLLEQPEEYQSNVPTGYSGVYQPVR
jgi:hypothetical protein